MFTRYDIHNNIKYMTKLIKYIYTLNIIKFIKKKININ